MLMDGKRVGEGTMVLLDATIAEADGEPLRLCEEVEDVLALNVADIDKDGCGCMVETLAEADAFLLASTDNDGDTETDGDSSSELSRDLAGEKDVDAVDVDITLLNGGESVVARGVEVTPISSRTRHKLKL